MARKRRFLLGALYIPCLATVAGFLLMYMSASTKSVELDTNNMERILGRLTQGKNIKYHLQSDKCTLLFLLI